ncbi:LOW QUALITY PROTEIN: uncharacterized protein [Macrobrachium rosenbergii]|uniref:LOW QUALITY PROTEIN: uncharacterized protein n=1 Tax=Macrobrachium rosenbergii TaxID=79674 RepID=UPI0034D79903
MRRHSSIQLLLLSLTGCSWMLLFLTLTLSDYHAFKAYHASHVAAAHTTYTAPQKEIDPCDLCWGVGRNDAKEVLHGEKEEEEDQPALSTWGARLAKAVGIAPQEKRNATPTPKPLQGQAGGVGAFYYYTLHTMFTSLQIRLKKAQLVAGDVRAEVASLEEKVANLHDILVNQFSPRMNPYQPNSSFAKPSSTTTRSSRSRLGVKGPSDTSDPSEKVGDQKSDDRRSGVSANGSDVKPVVELPKKTVRRHHRPPENDIYALLHKQTLGAHLQTSLRSANDENGEKSKDKDKELSFKESTRHLLSYDAGAKKVSANTRRAFNESDFISKGRYKVRLGGYIFDTREKEEKECKDKGKPSDASAARITNNFLSITKEDIISSVSILIMDQGTPQGTPSSSSSSSSDGGREEPKETLAKLYPGIAVHFVTSSSSSSSSSASLHFPRNLRLMVHHVPLNSTLGSGYSVALDYITTPYVFVATNVSALSSPNTIEHLIWATEYLGVWAAGASLLPKSGQWHMGCLQVRESNYQITWTRKRLGTAQGYLLCHALEGPFVAVTSALRHLGWNAELPDAMSHLDLFLRASRYHHMLAAACPQEVFSVAHELVTPSRASLLSFARLHGFYSIQVPPGNTKFMFSCEEVAVNCGVAGFALPPCCRRELARLVRFLMDTCDAHGLLCELQEGTLMGAVKTGGVMPWEKDADITFHTNNFTALGQLKDVFERAGYSLHLVDNRWCCVDGKWAGGQGSLNTPHWALELYSQHTMDSEEDLLARRPRTRIQFDGSWVTAPTSPGLYVRNRYGNEMYRHAQHWLDTGKKSGWEDYEAGRFLPCSKPSHHACLDENLPDGNLEFRPLCLV